MFFPVIRTYTEQYSVYVEADSEEEALRKCWDEEVDPEEFETMDQGCYAYRIG